MLAFTVPKCTRTSNKLRFSTDKLLYRHVNFYGMCPRNRSNFSVPPLPTIDSISMRLGGHNKPFRCWCYVLHCNLIVFGILLQCANVLFTNATKLKKGGLNVYVSLLLFVRLPYRSHTMFLNGNYFFESCNLKWFRHSPTILHHSATLQSASRVGGWQSHSFFVV